MKLFLTSRSLRLDFVAKMASSHDATGPRDLLQGLVAGTSPIVCADFKGAYVRSRLPYTKLTELTMKSLIYRFQ